MFGEVTVNQRGNTTLKKIDLWLGGLLIAILSTIKKKRPVPTNPQRIGLLVTAAIGDTVLVSALGRGLKSKFPSAEIVLIHGPTNALIAPYIAGIDRKLSIPVTRPWKAVLRLRSLKLTALVDTGQWARLNALLSFFSGARFTVGFRTQGQHRHGLYDFEVEHAANKHEIENFQNLGSAWSVPSMPPQLISLPTPATANGPILFHVKPSGEKSWLKEWPEENWICLSNHFTNRGFKVQFTGSPEDAVALRKLIEKLSNQSQVELLAGIPFSQTLAALQNARLVISVNTGIMHIASVLGKNLVALHGPTNPRRWGPINPNSVSLESDLPCAPCLNLGFDYGCGENLCMRSLTTENVIRASAQFL